ncbi:phosphopantothenoylcysteine decarboxylase / phosphopantothenate--cysteine ligase [Proteiniborus ethanoligenes]|uniref:Coenzyme A biosynthesis bifunctional protein CoaBC n=1 Tax=Proteiniborus ethanoligenes TaxID=415015 RepID=A0A1H3PK90_9FIRM|nr:bifunctional phosphopantothenoylcysteine decarboxylase/phosphopantothenate--cysteine ligase CoaBC [Proteiniborus ethanoligenes]TAH64070.1 MAG: bifunctional phosphopantothenoylcysteine decarboxylase/phosphopantothenate--cysteine ligase CoaBC [Gottschalkiaceae bacterium]SDZ01564.1 phosphopantothenoylcysteine decarboxylase / phosphopantothenate--cysteine ligase [Proteiniborus ethanoligenes]
MLSGKNIVMGVSGGIAVYKAVDVVSRLRKLCANVDVIMTRSATEFVTPLTFQSISQNPVTVDIFKEPTQWEIEHISLAKKAHVFLVAPATANIIGKVANGIADDMLSTTIMATKAKVVFAPAMNTNMYNNIIFKENMDKLKKYGYEFIKPGTGRLACGDFGEGKMAEPADIVDYIVQTLTNDELKGRKIIVTAGPTIEPLDPVRYMTNHSSGKMGYAIAKEAKQRGAEVILISGPVNLEPPSGVELIKVNTTEEMHNAVEKHFESCDVLVKAAAPLDYRPVTVSKNKIKKDKAEIEIKFTRNPDIVACFGKMKKNQLLVGFAAETENLIENAKKKIVNKNLDFIVANNILAENAGFKYDTNIITIIDRDGTTTDYPLMKKEDAARVIIDKISVMLNC